MGAGNIKEKICIAHAQTAFEAMDAQGLAAVSDQESELTRAAKEAFDNHRLVRSRVNGLVRIHWGVAAHRPDTKAVCPHSIN